MSRSRAGRWSLDRKLELEQHPECMHDVALRMCICVRVHLSTCVCAHTFVCAHILEEPRIYVIMRCMCYAGTATSSHVPSPVKKVYNQIVRLTTREKRKNIKWYPPINVAELGRPRLQSRPVDLHLCLTLVGGFHLILRCAASILVITCRKAVWCGRVSLCAPATLASRPLPVGPQQEGQGPGAKGKEKAGDGARRRWDGHEAGRGGR